MYNIVSVCIHSSVDKDRTYKLSKVCIFMLFARKIFQYLGHFTAFLLLQGGRKVRYYRLSTLSKQELFRKPFYEFKL